MNILIPDSWLRDYLKTKATPEQIKEYLSLCGPSVERITKVGKEIVYDIEITGNRPDAMSVTGIAREAAAILPRFGLPAKFVNDPYAQKFHASRFKFQIEKKLQIKTDAALNPRWTSIVLTNVRVGPSPAWMQTKLTAAGIRPVNNVVDVTNYLMRAYGQPVHAFDYEEINGAKMTLRESKKGEKIVTLDGKTHLLAGGDIVIEDGDGRLIDLCGIMGGYNSSIKNSTASVVLFVQTYNPVNIRKTVMALSHRTEAASLFEKSLDPELVLPTIHTGIELLEELAGASIAGRLHDIYPKPFKPYAVSVNQKKLEMYIGKKFKPNEIENILKPLGLDSRLRGNDMHVTIPSWRRDITIDVDLIEEIARIYGYHTIQPKLPSAPPPVVIPDPELHWEYEIKTRLRDWGFTEVYSYSMISEKLLGGKKAYKILNPLSEEWVYMRPGLIPGMLAVIAENRKWKDPLKLFELSMVYEYRNGDLPREIPMLAVAWSGSHWREAKGIAEIFGTAGDILEQNDVTVYCARVSDIAKYLSAPKTYMPIPKYPPIIEDFSFAVPPDFRVGPMIEVLSKVHKLIHSVALLDAFENKRTLRVTYLDPTKTLTNLDIAPVHQKILEYAAEKFGVSPVI